MTTLDLETFDRDFAAFLARLAPDAAVREQDRALLHDEVQELFALGFGRLRLPVAHGGAGIGLDGLFARIVDLAAADASLGHLVRSHVHFVEQLVLDGLLDGEPTPHLKRWVGRLTAGAVVGNAQSERHAEAVLETRIDRDGEAITLSGTKYYTTGSLYADWIHLAALDGEHRVAVTVSTAHAGVRSIDDWDGFGQPLTGSGTTVFDRVPVFVDDVTAPTADRPERWHYTGAVLQLALLAAIAGILQRAVTDTVAFVQPRRRTFGFAGATPPREDPLVQQVVGELSAVAGSARSLVVAAARDLDAARIAVEQGAGAGLLEERAFDVFRLQYVIPHLALEALGELFEVGGASAVARTTALDRHWRNVRTLASHNPVAQRTRALGDLLLNDRSPAWSAPGAAVVAGAAS